MLGCSLLILFEEGNGNVYFNVLLLILGFYSPYLKKLLEIFSFGLQIFVTSSTPFTFHVKGVCVKLKMNAFFQDDFSIRITIIIHCTV